MVSWQGLLYRFEAVFHKIFHPSHRMRWRAEKDILCTGNIICETCNHIYWCRVQEMSQKQIQKISDGTNK